MGRKQGHKRIEFLLDPEDERELAISTWIDQQKGDHDGLKGFMLAVLEWAMTGQQPIVTQQAAMPTVTVNIDQNAFIPIAEAVGQSVGDAVRAAYADVKLLYEETPKKADGQRVM